VEAGEAVKTGKNEKEKNQNFFETKGPTFQPMSRGFGLFPVSVISAAAPAPQPFRSTPSRIRWVLKSCPRLLTSVMFSAWASTLSYPR
jgi:hypothetical protein